ncbi:carboxymethylenebutenolidase [Geodermatophilus saharensis]|uniref:Carboxymethylenebutenolidase n=1 Tax=Geodermatophilus saharensis TaxID=1137994 RepID=A0A239CTA1_9ACTN|nr:dienelactone hydrolase family protein [Geodermatophilus saharensis]SNS22744.1 carboxymethylenebutenolidase [Geodermatophilus saharensis]
MTDLQRAAISDVEIPAAPGGTPRLRGVLGVPGGPGPWPGVVLLHEAFGVDGVMRRQVQRLADAGYLALVPDLFSDGGARRSLVRTFKAVAAGEGRPFADLEAARAHLAALPGCTGRLGVLGSSVGGGLALHVAARGFDAAAVFYARLPEDPHTALLGACPVVAGYGGADPGLRGTAAELTAVLTRLGVPHDVREYPGVGHGFLHDAPVGPRPLRPLLRNVLRIRPDPAAAADTWARTETWFARHLRG